MCVDGKMRPLSAVITAGQRNDGTQLEPVLDAIAVARERGRPRKRPTRLRVDRAYGARTYRKAMRRRGIRMICPERKDARAARIAKGRGGGRPPAFDAEAYKGRNVVERCFARLKDYRAVCTRFDKRGYNYEAGVLLACIMLWL